MDLNRLTERSQEALSQAQATAVRFGHVEVDGEHLLDALLEQPDGLLPRLLQRLDVGPDAMRRRVEDELGRRPRAAGPGHEAGKVYVTQRLNQILVKAQDEAQRLKDEYVSVEHLVLALIDEGRKTPAGRVFQE